LEEGTKTYESVGRMFVLTPIDQVKESLQKKQALSEEKIKVLVNNMAYLQNSLKDATNSLRELVQQKKES
jgi:prefoldin subunit 1